MLSAALARGDLEAARAVLAGLTEEDDRDEAIWALDLTHAAVRRGVQDLHDTLVDFAAGLGALIVAAVLTSDDPVHDPAITTLLGQGARFDYPDGDAILLAKKRQPDAVELRLMAVGTRRYPHNDYLRLADLGQVIRMKASADVDLTVLERAEAQTHTPGLFLNTTHIRYERGEWAEGIAVVDRHEAAHPIGTHGWLNAALLHLGAGHIDRARAYNDRAAAAGDLGAGMVAAALQLAQGDRADALAKLRAVKKTGYGRMRDWKDDSIFASLADDAEAQALFG